MLLHDGAREGRQLRRLRREARRDRPLSIDRLIPALRQLVDGVSALHRPGKLHRDIKPSNVLVTPEGRVVILDFGLIAELLPRTRSATPSYVSGGTPAYMSPEEGSGAPPSEASDWYGVGVTLYEALTGRVPFAGPLDRRASPQERTSIRPPPAEVAPDVPADLSAICMGLLCRDPAQRLSGAEALRRLARDRRDRPRPTHAGSRVRDAPFVGRDRQLHVLDEACSSVTADARRPCPSTARQASARARWCGAFSAG